MSSLRWPGDPKDVNAKVVVGPDEVREIDYLEHDAGDDGVIEFDRNTLEIQPMRWAHGPIKVPAEFIAVDQPYVNTCSAPSATNRGCHSHRGCPYRGYPGVGPFNVIIKRKTRSEYVPCYNYFTAKGRDGYRSATLSYKTEGWELDTSKTTVQWKSRRFVEGPDGSKRKQDFFTNVEVPDLGPMYAHLKEAPNGHHPEGDQERTEVQGGPGNGSVQTGPSGRGGSQGNGEGPSGSGAPEGVQAVRVGGHEREDQEVREDGDRQDNGPSRARGRDSILGGAKVSSSRVGKTRNKTRVRRKGPLGGKPEKGRDPSPEDN